MQTIIIETDNRGGFNTNDDRHILNGHVEEGKYFDDFVESQKIGPKSDGSYKKRGLSNAGAVNLRTETVDILEHCNPHNATNNEETTHLVIGYVQSGKTMSFTGLTALAKDNGYRMVVYLAGTKTNLLDQTTSRLEHDLIGKFGEHKDAYRLYVSPTKDDITQITGHLSMQSRPIILIPVLKHYMHIQRLTEILESDEFKEAMQGETVIIIDDEADQASLNSYGRKNSQKQTDEASSTYDAILKMRAVLPGNTYVQYTATPQANLLISMQDLLSPKSHTVLQPGEGYIGGKLFFGKGENHELYNGGLIIDIPENQVFHKKRNILKTIPQSLIDALLFHILAVAIVVRYYHTDDVHYLSMMVHPDNTKRWNRVFKRWIDNQLKKWRKAISQPDGNDDKAHLMERLEFLFPLAVQYYDEDTRPSFDDIKKFIPDILNDWKSYLVNTDNDADRKIEWNKFTMHVLVGAEMLNRGFTIEKLTTTYMPRYTIGPTNADTIQQRCRFFGYKMDYIKSCRVFLPEVSIVDYCNYVEHEEELRNFLLTSDTLSGAEHKILLSPSLRPTRQNVLPVSVVNTKLKGMHAMNAFESKSLILANDKMAKEFLDLHKDDFLIKYEYNTTDRTHRAFNMSIDEAVEFLSNFRFGNYEDAQRKAATIRYLRYLSGTDKDDSVKQVHFIEMAYAAGVRHRGFDYEHKKLAENTRLFTGQSKDGIIYPGDDKIASQNQITIQLHHIHLDGAPIDFAHEAYTLAIYYPESLAVNYCQNVEDVDFDDDDDDDDDDNLMD